MPIITNSSLFTPRQPRWGTPPFNRSDPFGRILDGAWIGNSLSGISNHGYQVLPHSSSYLSAEYDKISVVGTGNTFSNVSTSTAIPPLTTFPIVLFWYGVVDGVVSGTYLNAWSNNPAGSNLALDTGSSSFVEMSFRLNFGTQRYLSLNIGLTYGRPLLMIGQVFSNTDYRLYCDGLMATQTLNAGTPPFTLNNCNAIGSAGTARTFALGYGQGRGFLPDDYAVQLTAPKNQEKIWSIFQQNPILPTKSVLAFPSSPTDNQLYEHLGRRWTYESSKTQWTSRR